MYPLHHLGPQNPRIPKSPLSLQMEDLTLGCRSWAPSFFTLAHGKCSQTLLSHKAESLRSLISAYGSYQSYYENNILSLKSSGAISWIGTVETVLVMLGGMASGPFFDRGYIKELLTVESFLIVFGFMMLSLASEYYQILLAQGFCVGLGSGLIYTPSLALIATVFMKKRSIAIALVSCGAPVGEASLQISLQ
jgi:MFS family permease